MIFCIFITIVTAKQRLGFSLLLQLKRLKKLTLLCFVLALLCSTQLKSQDSLSTIRFSSWLVNDPVYIAKNFGKKELRNTGFIAIGLFAVSRLDESSNSKLNGTFSNSPFFNFTNEIGVFNLTFPASATVFGISLLSKNSKFQDAAFTSMQSVLYTKITVNTSKFIFGRSRPYEEVGAFDFNFFQMNGTSFPSGHASNSFALITPWVMYYPGWLTYSLMTIPIGTSIARITKGKHWLSDVTAGAIIGSYWGYSLSKQHIGKKTSNVTVMPVFLNEGGALSLTVEF